ncbi:hypothetical protein J4N45_10395 [Vibrio sp. SCSIO 43140]|uniref:hypothetical protein n=1 Tax=Vibrio sp. SCSIO 43140 TaxID=2819100 RepID=UPI002075FE2D|nr:hypothetical protein [Vibrio sp. SCSIO 43140]USD58939.1 hypothetical protein J4N45_10395 [Vibrio sp. SCSIO 43140]
MSGILSITHPELSHTGKRVLIERYLQRCSSKNVTYSFSVTDNQLTVSPAFKSQEAYDRVESGILEILSDMCEEMDSRGRGCSDHYNCCDCGGENCGCRYCFSCNACHECLGDDDE